MDQEGCGLVSPIELERALKRESRLEPANSIAKAKAMRCEEDPGGARQAASYSEFLACCLGVNYSEVSLYWYDIPDDMTKFLLPLLAISAFEREYFLQAGRITWSPSAALFCGRPARAQKLGITVKSLDDLREFIFMELDPQFNEQT
jgi:hypothetical protein